MSGRSGFDGLRRMLRIRRVHRDLDEELAFHLTETVEELMAGGMARGEAEAEAHRCFGDPRHRKRLATIDRAAARRRRWRARVGAIGDGARFAIRGIARSPGLSLGIVLVFALGLGANATMYGTIERLLLRPPDHIRDPGRVGPRCGLFDVSEGWVSLVYHVPLDASGQAHQRGWCLPIRHL